MFEPPAVGAEHVAAENVNNAMHVPGGYVLLTNTLQNTVSSPVTSIEFDADEELLWSGNNAGRVVSYYGPQLDRYTSFVSGSSDVRGLLSTETAIFSLTRDRLRGNRRQGVPLFTHASENMVDMTCLHRLANAPHTVLMGGNQPKIIQLDVEKQKETRIVHLKQKDCLDMRSNQKFLFSSDSDGNITLRNLSTIDPIHAIQAHQGAISDFDIHGNKLITCGYSPRMGSMLADRFLMVYDLRTLRALPLVPLALPPAFCRFLPTYSDGRIMIVAQGGQVLIMDINKPTGLPLQLDTSSLGIYSVGVSISRQCLAFGDHAGLIYLFGDRLQPVFNENSWETEFPEQFIYTPSMEIDDIQAPYAAFLLPFTADESYLSDWPEDLCEKAFRKPDPIPKQILDSIRMVQFVGYAPNPKAGSQLSKFNVKPYSDEVASSTAAQEAQAVKPVHEGSPIPIPKFYRRVHVQPSKYNNEEFDYIRYNHTEYIPIECYPSLPQANAVLLALFHIATVRNYFLKHMCAYDYCLSCEIGFLYRMLSDRLPTQPASITNFVRTLRSMNDYAHLFAQNSTRNFMQKTRAFLESVFDKLQKEIRMLDVRFLTEHDIEFNMNNRCVRCSGQFQTQCSQLCVRLAYPSNGGDKIKFHQLIQKSLNCPDQSEVLCQRCEKVARVASTRKVRKIARLLFIDTSVTTENEKSFWDTQLQAFEKKPSPKLITSGSSPALERIPKTCRYGEECKKPFCKYSHSGESKTEVSSDYEDIPSGQSAEDDVWMHYIPAEVYIKISDGICTVAENSFDSAISYSLRSAVFAIGEGGADSEPTHLVAAVRPKLFEKSFSHHLSPNVTLQNRLEDRRWVVFNDFVVTKVTENEALHVDASWKLPCLLCYVQTEADRKTAPQDRIQISAHQWDNNILKDQIFNGVSLKQLPAKGSIVAIDAEFITINQETTRTVARVSCVTEDGRCLLDAYIVPCCTDTVTDYLTAWSGIEAADLDPKLSTRNLTSLKDIYLKLLYLVQEGVVFVGHGLSNDFKALNIYVPPEQVRDTVHLFHLPAQRMISLQFLAWHIFGESIQQTSHDSVEDARMALRLYKKYQELKANKKLEAVITDLYETGKRLNWKAGDQLNASNNSGDLPPQTTA